MPNPISLQAELERGRLAYAERAWQSAYDALSTCDAQLPLDVEDLERLAQAASILGRDEVSHHALERAYEARLLRGENCAAALAAFWLGFRLLALGEAGRANAWLGRARALVEREEKESAAHGFVLLPLIYQKQRLGEHSACYEIASEVAAIGDRLGNIDLSTFGRNLQGRALIRQGEIERGMALMDESMLATISGRLSPILTGLLYCGVISTYQRVHAVDRAREWTHALSGWCEAQQGVIAFHGACLVHRAELLQLGGAWPEALAEARSARDAAHAHQRDAISDSHYQEGEIHRLQGNFEEAERAFEAASQAGGEPQPGLALLRLCQGKGEAAANAMRRVLAEVHDPLLRLKFLPAAVEIFLCKKNDLEAAREACQALDRTATDFPTEALVAMAAQARGALRLREGDAQAALGPLRRAFWVWQNLGAPYPAARVRVNLAEACQALGDAEGARLELAAARAVFEELGAAPDLLAIQARYPNLTAIAPEATPVRTEFQANVTNPPGKATHKATHGLSERELQVLRLVASGKPNKQVANELFLSQKTVDRHLSNIFCKLAVTSRTAAAAYAYEHGLI